MRNPDAGFQSEFDEMKRAAGITAKPVKPAPTTATAVAAETAEPSADLAEAVAFLGSVLEEIGGLPECVACSTYREDHPRDVMESVLYFPEITRGRHGGRFYLNLRCRHGRALQEANRWSHPSQADAEAAWHEEAKRIAAETLAQAWCPPHKRARAQCIATAAPTAAS